MRTSLYILALIIVCACKQQTPEVEVRTFPSQESEAQEEFIGDLNETSGSFLTTFKEKEIGAIYNSYLDVKAALVNTNVDDATKLSNELKKMLSEISIEGKDLEDLKLSIEKFSLSDDIKEQRVIFKSITNEVEMLISGELTSGEIIKQYCPMAFDGKGAYWLSDSKEIRNPYFGDKMLKCGVVDEEIK